MSDQAATLTFEQALAALSERRRAFVRRYLACLNGAEAARRAGYASGSARQTAYELLTNPDIREAIRLGLAEQTMPREEVLARLTLFATASLEDFIALPVEEGADDTALPDEAAAGASPPMPHHWRLDLAKAKRLGKLATLKRLKWGEHGPEIELHDPVGPLTTLAKHHGLIVERSRQDPDGPPIPWEKVPEALQVAYLNGKLTLADVVASLQPGS